MKSRKKAFVILLAILIGAMLLVALPMVTARFLGSHTWYETPSCVKCHKDKVAEASSSTTNAGPHKQTQANTNCEDCHEYGVGAHYVNRSYGFCGSRSGCHPTYPAVINSSGHGTVPTKPVPISCIMCHTGVNLTLKWKEVKNLIIIVNYTAGEKHMATFNWTDTNITIINVGKIKE